MEEKLSQILTQDIGLGDVTVSAVIPKDLQVKAEVIAKEAGVVAGVEEAVVLAEYVGLKVKANVADGQDVVNKQVLLESSGNAQTILTIERTLLNIMSRMSGIATKTKTLTQKINAINPNVKIAATRKSAPGMLYFDKKAVIIGGGDAHRLHLDDMVLIKDNHLAIVGSVEKAVQLAKQNASFSKKIEVEVTSKEDAVLASKAGADIIMLDNFSPDQIREAAELLVSEGFLGVLEASGGINEQNIAEYAKAPVNIISLGALTHSVKALDISLEITKNS
ncbi:MAG: carboxylating nicotinate-nucleotide diphosphorylase [Candidatus Bathyarchaeota archaeon]|nr:carboxylating nicotinate-nucleotide diphosphorylase [Candidatus Bathyarchaeota archaeon]